mgnify:CR=1 FL=1
MAYRVDTHFQSQYFGDGGVVTAVDLYPHAKVSKEKLVKEARILIGIGDVVANSVGIDEKKLLAFGMEETDQTKGRKRPIEPVTNLQSD